MKYLKLFFLLLIPVIFLSGCGEDKLAYSTMYRDDKNIGGSLTFDYDSITHTAYFGGEGESVSFYQMDIVQGFYEKGNRVGVKLYAPIEINEFDSGKATVGEEKIEGGEFYQRVGESKTREAIFYPIVDEDKRKVEIKLTWADGIEEQTYYVVIKDGTSFLKDNDEIM